MSRDAVRRVSVSKVDRLLARTAAAAVALLLHACGAAPGSPPSPPCSLAAPTADVCIRIDANPSGPAVNRLVLGSNVQWVDGGDNLLRAGTTDFDPDMQRLVISMSPTVLRYPGGEQSDWYDWTRGLVSIAARGSNPRAGTHRDEITTMGTVELLTLSDAIGAAPLFTVNIVTGSAASAAAWVKATNVTGLRDAAGKPLPKVEYWEIGNEPYLPAPDPAAPGVHKNACEVDPVAYAERANAFLGAMRAVDPGIKIGIALTNDRQNHIQFVVPACREFAATVLRGLTQPVDFISIHDAYLPYDPSGRDHPAIDEFHAAMAATESIQADLNAMRRLLRSYPKVSQVPFAMTEYNALFSLNPGSEYIHSMASPMGALYVADTLRLLAGRDDILMADLWSLSGNDHWGAIHPPTSSSGPYGRPTYEVLRLFGEALSGVRLTDSVQSPTFDAPSLGFSGAAAGLPLVTTLVTQSTTAAGEQTMRVLMIDKDYVSAHVAAISITDGRVTSAHLSVLESADVLESDDLPGSMRRTESDLEAGLPAVTLPAHSVALLTLQLAR